MATDIPSSADRGPTAIALFWVFCASALVVVSLGLYSRKAINALGSDDWTMVLTMVDEARQLYPTNRSDNVTAAIVSRRHSSRDHISSSWQIHACSIIIKGSNGIYIKAVSA